MADGFFSSSWQILEPYGCAVLEAHAGFVPSVRRVLNLCMSRGSLLLTLAIVEDAGWAAPIGCHRALVQCLYRVEYRIAGPRSG
jgi:hypothetical protein